MNDSATILVDLPWNVQQVGTGCPPYPLLTSDQIADLGVAALAQPNAHPWLCVTNASLFAGQSVLESWGNDVMTDIELTPERR